MAGRFKLLADEHLSNAHVRAARDSAWQGDRVIDVLGRGAPDPQILAQCSRHGYVWVTTDQRARTHAADWLRSGATCRV